jgi:hypothetical protein
VDAVDPYAEVLRALKRDLIASGYTEFLASFGLLRYMPIYWRTFRHNAFPNIRPVVDFFLLNQAVHVGTLDSTVGDSWRVLLRLGLAEFVGSSDVRLPNHSLLFYFAHLFFVNSPGDDPEIYFGDDSLGLLYRLAPTEGASILDLCSGSGIQALHSASYAGEVHAVEINPRARLILSINGYLNGVQDRLKIYGGSLFESISADYRYDLIHANPPLVPFPDDVAYPFVGHGGMDGLAVTRKILQELPRRLNDRGLAQIIALAFSDGNRLSVYEELAELAAELQIDIALTIINQLPLFEGRHSHFEGLAFTAAATSHEGLASVRARLRSELTQRNVTHMAPYYILAKKGMGRLTCQNFSRPRHSGLWSVV